MTANPERALARPCTPNSWRAGPCSPQRGSSPSRGTATWRSPRPGWRRRHGRGGPAPAGRKLAVGDRSACRCRWVSGGAHLAGTPSRGWLPPTRLLLRRQLRRVRFGQVAQPGVHHVQRLASRSRDGHSAHLAASFCIAVIRLLRFPDEPYSLQRRSLGFQFDSISRLRHLLATTLENYMITRSLY
jgi:hypothetical protein